MTASIVPSRRRIFRACAAILTASHPEAARFYRRASHKPQAGRRFDRGMCGNSLYR